MIAIGLVHVLTAEPINDPRYLKWVNMHFQVEGGEYKATQANTMHPCTEEDYKRFSPPDKSAAFVVE